VPPSTVCTIPTNAAVDVTGLVATSTGYVVIDGQNNDWPTRVAYLDKTCNRIGSSQQYPSGEAVDPQDLAVDSKGVLWIADIGDQLVNPNRSSVALFKVTSKTSMTRYRFAYPDGPHSAQALLLNGNGAPIFVTKAITGPASIYTFSGTLATGKVLPLEKVGQFTPVQTGTANKLGTRGPAQNEVTGGAVAPGGKKVALRTLTDAYEWDVTNGDVIGALTKGKPRITPMPDEDQGFAIAYTTDGSSFLTVSDSPDAVPLLKYKPTAAVAAAKAAPTSTKGPGALRRWFNGLSFSQLMWLLAGVAAFGFVLLMIGIFGIRRSRRAFAAEAARGGDSAAAADDRSRMSSGGGGVYGAARSSNSPNSPSSPAGGTVYGGDPYAGPGSSGQGQRSGGVYGGGQRSSGQSSPKSPGRSGGQYSGGQYSGGQYSGSQQGGGSDPYDDRQPGGRGLPYRPNSDHDDPFRG